MKRLLILTLALASVVSVSGQTYRYLKVETIRCDNHKWQELEWITDGVAHPVTKMTAVTSNGMTVTGDVGATELYKPYDGDVNTHAWLGYITPPQETKSITLDLGEGNALDPDSLRITKPTYSQVMDFRVWASNDMQDWAMLLDVKDLQSSGFATMEFKLEEVTDTSAPSVPENLQVNAVTANSIAFSWDPSVDDRLTLGYEVFVGGISAGNTAYTTFLVTGLEASTSYELRVSSYDEAGNVSERSDPLVASTKTPDHEPPTDPSGLTLDSASYHQLFFSWQASSDNDQVAAYLVYLNDEITGVADTNHFALPGLEPDSAYNIAVRAKDRDGNVSAGEATGNFKTSDNVPERMPIGTNFWNIGWGGEGNDPFVSGYEAVEVTDNPWKPAFLEETKIYSHFRFMDYLETNGSDLSSWMDRKQKAEVNQKPMAFEWMIHLCNTNQTDLWITVPHKVVSHTGIEGGNNHFMKKLAILVKTGVDMLAADLDDPVFDNIEEMTEFELLALGGVKTCEPLKPHLKFYLEYSNETWNGSFAQFYYCNQEGAALELDGDQYAKGRRFHAWAALRLFEDAEDVFGPDNPRIVKIDAYQAVVPGQINDHYSVYKDAALNPRGIYPDAFAPAPYFGNGEDGTAATIVEEMISGNSGILKRTNDLKTARQTIENEYEKGFPVRKLIAYEAGQHVINNAAAISRNPEIYSLYIRYLDSCNMYLDEMSHYVHSGTFGSGGAWGSKEYIGQDMSEAHKYRALYEWNYGIATRPDTEKPSAPETLTASGITENGYTLHWTPGTDNHKVTSYIVTIDGEETGTTSDTLLVVSDLLPGTTYSNTVQSVDSTGNVSDYSSPLEVTTPGTSLYTVTFRVKDADDGAALSDAAIIFNGMEKTTDTNGTAVFEDQESGTGYTYSVVHSEYRDTSGTVDISDQDVVLEIFLESVVGIFGHTAKWEIYPNPADDILRISHPAEGRYELKIYNNLGRLILEKEISGEAAWIDIAFLKAGLYTLEIVGDGHREAHLLQKE